MARFKFKFSKRKGRINLFECKSDVLNTQLITGSHIELFSNREIIIEGCRKILDYSTEYIKLQLEKGTLMLCGSNFGVGNFEANIITIRGKISTIEFCV